MSRIERLSDLSHPDNERSAAHLLQMSGRRGEQGYGRWIFSQRDAEAAASVEKDPYGLIAALRAEAEYAATERPTREARQRVSDAYKAAAECLHRKDFHALSGQALIAAADFTTQRDAKELQQEGVSRISLEDLSKRDPASVMWTARSIMRLGKGLASGDREALRAAYLREAQNHVGDPRTFEYFGTALLELSTTDEERKEIHRFNVENLEQAGHREKSAIMKQARWEEGARIATEKLHDKALAGRLLKLHQSVNPMKEMAVISAPLDLSEPLEALRQRIDAVLQEIDWTPATFATMIAWIRCFQYNPIVAMPAADEPGHGEVSIGDILPRKYVLADGNTRSQTHQVPRRVSIQRSISNQALAYEATFILTSFQNRVLARMPDLFVELRANPEEEVAFLHLEPVVLAWLRGEWYTCLAMGCVASESILRFAWRIGGKNPQYIRGSGTQHSILSGLLADEVLDEVLGEQVARHFRYLYDDEDGPNIRNIVLHGNADPRLNLSGWADTVLYLCLKAAARCIVGIQTRRQTADAAADAGAPTDSKGADKEARVGEPTDTGLDEESPADR